MARRVKTITSITLGAIHRSANCLNAATALWCSNFLLRDVADNPHSQHLLLQVVCCFPPEVAVRSQHLLMQVLCCFYPEVAVLDFTLAVT